MERLQKILARAGVSSRRAAELIIQAGRVRVNGHIVSELGAKADARNDKVELDGRRLVAEPFVYIAYHKPRGVVSTLSDPEGRKTVAEAFAEIGRRIYPVGRLDFATSGLLLATNDGDFAEGLMHPKRKVPKTYVVKVSGIMKPKDLDPWKKGIQLEDGMTAPALVGQLRVEGDKTWFELTISEGRNQQIRRMGEAAGFPVMRLSRVSVAGVQLGDMPPGAYRHLERDELMALKQQHGVPKQIRPSSSATELTNGRRRPGPAQPLGREGGRVSPPRGPQRGPRAQDRGFPSAQQAPEVAAFDAEYTQTARRGRVAEPSDTRSTAREGAARPSRGTRGAARGPRAGGPRAGAPSDARSDRRGAAPAFDAERTQSPRRGPARGPSRGPARESGRESTWSRESAEPRARKAQPSEQNTAPRKPRTSGAATPSAREPGARKPGARAPGARAPGPRAPLQRGPVRPHKGNADAPERRRRS